MTLHSQRFATETLIQLSNKVPSVDNTVVFDVLFQHQNCGLESPRLETKNPMCTCCILKHFCQHHLYTLFPLFFNEIISNVDKFTKYQRKAIQRKIIFLKLHLHIPTFMKFFLNLHIVLRKFLSTLLFCSNLLILWEKYSDICL